ncbi:MAG: hypothetical protein AVDCRST_MAG83-1550, partial [uncultured Arthrobacter sp.]
GGGSGAVPCAGAGGQERRRRERDDEPGCRMHDLHAAPAVSV